MDWKAWYKALKYKDLLMAGGLLFAVLVIFTILYSSAAKAEMPKAVVEFGFAFEPVTPTFGSNPYGDIFVGVETLPGLYAGYQHHSSVPDEHDRNVLDALLVKYRYDFYDTTHISSLPMIFEFGLGVDPGETVFGGNPYSDFFIGAFIVPCIQAGYVHHSSAPDDDDKNDVDGYVIRARVTFASKGIAYGC